MGRRRGRNTREIKPATTEVNIESNKFLIIILFLYIFTCISVIFNISYLRQIWGFFYLLFVPGYVFLKVLNLNEIDIIETILLSVGSSISILMFLGLFLNEIS